MMNPGMRKRLSEKSVSSASASQSPLFLDRWFGTMIPLLRAYMSVYMRGNKENSIFRLRPIKTPIRLRIGVLWSGMKPAFSKCAS
jgi:hypothetical protein